VVTLRSSEPNSQQSFFVVYNMLTTQVLAVFENTSQQLLDIFEDFCDLFRNSCLNSDARYTSSPSNNIYANLSQQRFKQTIISAKNGKGIIWDQQSFLQSKLFVDHTNHVNLKSVRFGLGFFQGLFLNYVKSNF
jgi:hypothetical protein